MTVRNIGNALLSGLSTDTKPTTYPTNAIFVETDTGDIRKWDGASWVLLNSATGGGGAAADLPHPGQGSYVVYKDASDANKIKARSAKTGAVVATHATDAGALLNSLHSLLVNGDTVIFETNTYTGSTNYVNTNRQRIHYIGNGSTIQGFKFVTSGSDWLTVRGWLVFRGFFFSGGGGNAATTGVSISDSFAPTFEHCLFFYCDSALEIGCAANFSELVKVSNCHFSDNRKSLTFKTPTGTGSGSYINSILDNVTFNASAADQTANYTHIEVQDNAIVNEGKWTNLRLWFADPNHIGVGIDLSGDATRCQLVKPVFENFSGVTGTIGIRYNAAADSGFYFAGRPVFTGAGTYAAKFSNASTKWALGSVSAFRESNTITIGTSGVYSTAATNSSIAEYAGIPSIFVTIGGTVGGSETITVELKIATTADDGTNTYTIEKTYTRAATSTLNIADYLSLTTNNHFYVMQNLQIRAKTSLASTSATVTVGTISASPCTGGDVQLNATNTYGDFSSIFRATRVKIRNPANTFSYTITGAGIAADRAVNLPVLTADDTLTFDAFATTLTNKTVNATNNTITDTSTATGDLLVSNGTKFVRRAKGTGLQYLRTNSGATDLEWGTLDSEKVGKSTASGNGSTTIFNIPHGLGSNPTYAYVDCSSIVNTYTYTTDATNIVVTFTPTAPPSGTNNVVIYWRVVA